MSVRVDREDLRRRYERRISLLVPAPVEMLRGLSLFSGVPEKARDKVIEKVRKYLHVVELAKGDYVLREGDYSDSAYFIISGVVEVVPPGGLSGARGNLPQVRGGAHNVPVAQRQGARPQAGGMIGRGGGTGGTVILSALPSDLVAGQRTLLEAGEVFGEIGALSRYAVSASVRAESPLRLLQIRLPALRMLMAASKEFKKFLDTRYRERALAAHLRHVALFASLDDAVIDDLRNSAELVSFDPGAVIVQEGTPADSFFLVRGGYVKVAVRAGEADLAVTYLRKGDYAGEAALLLDESWPFTLQALEHVELVKLPQSRVRQILERQPQMGDQLWADLLARLKARGAVTRDPTSGEFVQMAMETGLIHGESVLLIDLSTCTRCDECVRGCADAHDGQPVFIREGTKYRNWLIPTACYQCTDPVCMMDCPTGAISRELGTLEVTINEPTCIGCGNCANRCPWSNIVMVHTGENRPDGKPVELATKCDLCLTRPEGPACVQMCPHGCAVRISFKDIETVTSTLK
jgi:CRP-like cAMP-binding protein/Fe-S-cluster-containing hydrogenase component 2